MLLLAQLQFQQAQVIRVRSKKNSVSLIKKKSSVEVVETLEQTLDSKSQSAMQLHDSAVQDDE